MSGDTDAFERIAATRGSPMVIVTARAGDEMDGCLVGFSTQCSIDPKRCLVCLSKANRTYRIARNASSLVVHALHDAPEDYGLARLFGESSGADVDKLSLCTWEPGPDGVPTLTTCDWFGGTIIDRVDLGDHVGFVLDIVAGGAARAGEPWLDSVQVRGLEPGNPA